MLNITNNLRKDYQNQYTIFYITSKTNNVQSDAFVWLDARINVKSDSTMCQVSTMTEVNLL